jgi:SAM-dependent methyltransferase
MIEQLQVTIPPAGNALPQPYPAECYACPACQGHLEPAGRALLCAGCGRHYPLLDTAYADFAEGVSFDDWWVQSAELQQRWLAEEAPREAAFQESLARNYTLPLLRRLGFEPGRAAVLSAACGLAADVEALNRAGYATWGIDCGSRVLCWAERACRERLARADLFRLPFADGSFDFVQCLNVLEHIGTVGDTTRVTPDYEQQRVAAMRSLLRVVRPGGYLLLSGVSRHFPLDFFHLQEVRLVRLHSPWEPFSLSCGDYRRLAHATGYAEWTRPLPLRGFFSWTNLGRRRLLRPLLPLADWALGCLPAGVYGSAFSFFTIVLVRRAAPAARPARNASGTSRLL